MEFFGDRSGPRTFRSLKLLVSLSVLFWVSAGGDMEAGPVEVQVVERPPASGRNECYVGNREPLQPDRLIKLPIRSITPKGWLYKQLRLQADGFHGHLGEISGFLKKENNAWLSPKGLGEHGWEEVPYWLKGFSNCGYVLRDERMIREARIWLEGALRSLRPDGWFGPERNKRGLRGRPDLWPNMIMLFCLQDYYDWSGDKRVIDLMTRYCKYLMTIPEEDFLAGYWPKMRGGDLLYSVYWLYNRTGDDFLLDLARKVHRRTADWTSGIINWHNVNISQGFREPTIYWQQSNDIRHLKGAYRNYETIRRLYGQVPGGMFGGDENCRPGYTGPRQAIETCGIVEMMLSCEILAGITGDPLWADRCEDAAFNTFPAALTADLKALRYLTAPNMVVSDRRSKSPGLQNGGPMLWMNPHIHRCCQHNFGHGWPYYAEHLWYATRDNGLAAVFYSASEVKAQVGDGTEVTVTERTCYPFEEQIRFIVSPQKPVEFPLYLRIPGWCSAARVSLNGVERRISPKPLQYIVVRKKWEQGDTVVLSLPMEIRIRTWKANKNSVSVDRGPLTFSLKIGEKYVRSGGTDKWPAWEIFPTSPWNYGLVLKAGDPGASFEVIKRGYPADDMPFTHKGAPLELLATGRRIPQWRLDHLGLVGPLQESPVFSDQPEERITLIPMGAARLRISAFPVIGTGPEAHKWRPPPSPAYRVRASHCFESDTVQAVADGLEPRNSNDHSIPRFTWWDHRGTKEWIQAEFESPRKVSRVSVYWFDDTGRGFCRVPASWRLFYRTRGKWVPVPDPSGFETARDRYNTTTFSPVVTDALRIEVILQEGYSGGILEWKIK